MVYLELLKPKCKLIKVLKMGKNRNLASTVRVFNLFLCVTFQPRGRAELAVVFFFSSTFSLCTSSSRSEQEVQRRNMKTDGIGLKRFVIFCRQESLYFQHVKSGQCQEWNFHMQQTTEATGFIEGRYPGRETEIMKSNFHVINTSTLSL